MKQQHRVGAAVMGICGGYQMLGESVEDPDGVESARAQIDGLGLLPCRTRLTKEKVTRRVDAVSCAGTSFSAYEIHMGETVVGRTFVHLRVFLTVPMMALSSTAALERICTGRWKTRRLYGKY